MSIIDSGLGWSCDSDYYVYNANTTVGYQYAYGHGYSKKQNDGAAVAVGITVGSTTYGRYNTAIISTIKDNAAIHWQNKSTGGAYLGAFDIDGIQWHMYCMEAGNNNQSENSYFPYYPDTFSGIESVSSQSVVRTLLDFANVQVTLKKIPTTDYVKAFVEGVEAETARRVKTNTANIGTLSNLKTNAKSDLVSAINELCGTVYTFHIDPDEADSYDAVTYHDDAIGMTPAYMDSTAFNYGSWENAFFMPKPCMLNYDGTVAYYLDPNDYTKKADGTPSDISDFSFPGNAMMEFPLIWWKSWGDGWVSIADYQVDATYKCWSNRDADGNIIPYFYLPIYNGCIYDGKMRSISGIQLKSWSTTAYSNSATYAVGDEVNHNSRMWKCITAVETPEDFDSAKWEQFAFNGNTTGEEEIAYATANNTTSEMEWYTDQWCDRVLIQGLLVLMSKSIDIQAKFGRGIDSGSESAKESYITGSLDDKGLFYGSTSNGNTAVKVFGMENYWALQWRRVAGLIGSTENGNNTYLYKMTASTADGTTVKGYNTTGSGYITASGRPSEHNWLKKMQFGQFGALPLEVGSYSAQYYKDHYWTGTGYAWFGGGSGDGAVCGAFSLNLHDSVGDRYWYVGAAPSCKPCLIKEVIINE